MNRLRSLFSLIVALLLTGAALAQTPLIQVKMPGLYPEGVAYSEKTRTFLISSVKTGQIGTVTMEGQYRVLYQDSTIRSSFGIRVDPRQDRIWVCTADPNPNYSRYSQASTRKKVGRLLCIDLATGKKLADVDLAALYPGNHFLNDLAFDGEGNLYVTDSFSPVVYRVDRQGQASVFAENAFFKGMDVGLNGIAYHPGGFLLVAGNRQGALYKIDLQDPKRVTKVKVDTFFPGADGLLLTAADTLVLVQNKGVDKVFQLTSTDNWQSARVQAATAAEDRFQQPSTATMANGRLYVLNSKLNELTNPTKRPSPAFTIQPVHFRPAR